MLVLVVVVLVLVLRGSSPQNAGPRDQPSGQYRSMIRWEIWEHYFARVAKQL